MKIHRALPALLFASVSVHAQAQIPPTKADFQVSEGTTGYQFNYGVSIDRAGRFVVTWTDDGSSSSYDCFGRLYDATGAAEGGEFLIDPSDAHQSYGYVAKDQSGRFIVAWQEGETSVRARRFHADGTPVGASFPVNTGTLPVFDPRVASDPSGNFVVAWTREGADPTFTDVVARLFDSSNAPVADEFVVNAHTTDVQEALGVASSGTGFVVVWEGYGAAGRGILARRYDANGSPLTGDLAISDGSVAEVAMSGSGSFVVTWIGQVLSGTGVFARRYDAVGAPLGDEFVVNTTYTSGIQAYSNVASDDAGNFIVSWTGYSLDGDDSGVAAKMFDRFGTPVSSEFIVHTTTTDYQYGSQVALNSAGKFVVTWQSADNDAYGVFARLGAVHAAAPITVAPVSLGNLSSVIEPGESVRVETAWVNQGESAVTILGTATDFSGPAGATYTLDDATAEYPTTDPGGTGPCNSTGDCYEITVSDPAVRPLQHWDALLQEATSIGLPHTWVLHIGESFPDVPD